MSTNHPLDARCLTIALTLLLGAGAAEARTWYVRADAPAGGDGSRWGRAFRTLQAAFDAVGRGDEILVAGGTYAGGARLDVGNVTIRGVGSVVDGRNQVSSGIVADGLNGDVTVEGMDFRNFRDAGLRIGERSSGATVRDCAFSGNRIALDAREDTTVEDSRFTVADGGYGVVARANAHYTVRRSVFTAARPGRGRGLHMMNWAYSRLSIRENTFSGLEIGLNLVGAENRGEVEENTFVGGGTAIRVEGGEFDIVQNVVRDADRGLWTTGSTSNVVFNTLLDVDEGIRCTGDFWWEDALIANNAVRANVTAFAGEQGCRGRLRTNAFHGGERHVTGPYEDEGANRVGRWFDVTASYAPTAADSILVDAATTYDGLTPELDFGNRVRTAIPDIGAGEWSNVAVLQNPDLVDFRARIGF